MAKSRTRCEWVFERAKLKGHEQLSYFFHEETGLKAVISIHSTTLGPAMGGTRMWNYKDEEDCVREALRLSELMTYQSALSGADFGGGKAVLWGRPKKDKSEAYLRAYGRFLEGLGGRFLTYADLGVDDSDMLYVRRETKAALSPPREGAEVLDTADVTAYGVLWGMKACAKEVFGNTSLAGLRVAVQGAGEVGKRLCSYLAKEEAQIVVSDLSYDAVKIVQDSHHSIKVVRPEEILEAPCDIFCPCAVAGVLNKATIPGLKCKIVAGAATGVLGHESDGDLLGKQSILYAPDFAVSCGSSIIYSGLHDDLPVKERHKKVESVFDIMARVIGLARKEGTSTLDAAIELATKRIREVGRVRRIHS